LDAVLQLLRMGYMLEDQFLIGVALASTRFRVIRGIETEGCLNSLIVAYTKADQCEEYQYKLLMERMFLPAALRMRSQFAQGGLHKEEMLDEWSAFEEMGEADA
jgi:hypothetical protein